MKTGSFKKYENNPVFGNKELGTMFDAYVWEDNGRLRMDMSWRGKSATAVTFSDDGIHWDEPTITMECKPESGWEKIINRNCVLRDPKGDGYLMYYTGQWGEPYIKYSNIGVAYSDDGIHFKRIQEDPVLKPEMDFEGDTVMCPFVMFEDGKFRMWYAAGETYEPNVLCYAESDDGIHWNKYAGNPVLQCAPENEHEQQRVGPCHVYREDDGYLMFYIGYRDIDTACVCAARSKDGITGWERVPENPLITPTPGTWDECACYKPTVVRREDGTYSLWYNGRRGVEEYIGYAEGRIG